MRLQAELLNDQIALAGNTGKYTGLSQGGRPTPDKVRFKQRVFVHQDLKLCTNLFD